MDRAWIEKIFPRFEDFRRIRKELEPEGVLLGSHLTPLFE